MSKECSWCDQDIISVTMVCAMTACIAHQRRIRLEGELTRNPPGHIMYPGKMQILFWLCFCSVRSLVYFCEFFSCACFPNKLPLHINVEFFFWTLEIMWKIWCWVCRNTLSSSAYIFCSAEIHSTFTEMSGLFQPSQPKLPLRQKIRKKIKN